MKHQTLLFVFHLLLVSLCLAQESTTTDESLVQTTDGNITTEVNTILTTHETTPEPTDEGPKGGSLPDGVSFIIDKLGVDWYGPVKWFIKLIIPKDLPIESIKKISEAASNGSNLAFVKDDILKVVRAEATMMVFVAFGFAMAILLPFCGLISLCCLCCSSKKVSRPTKKTKRNKSRLTIFLSVLLLVILVGIVYMFAAGSTMNRAFDEARNKLFRSIDGTNTLLNNTQKQIEFLVGDSYTDTLHEIRSDLDNIDELYGKKLINKIKITVNTDKLANALDSSVKELDKISSLMNDIIQLIDDVDAFNNTLQGFKDNVTSMCSPGPTCPSLDGLQIQPPGRDVVSNETVNKISDMRNKLTEASSNVNNITVNFPQKVKEKTEDARKEIITKMREFQDTIKDVVKEFRSSFNAISNKSTSFKSKIDDLYEEDMIKSSKQYLYSPVTGLTCLVFLIWVFFLFGLCGGCMFYQGGKSPDERSCASSCSGCLLILGMACVFLFSFIFWVICTSLFAVGGHFDAYICKPLYDEPDFKVLRQYTNLMDRDKGGSVLGDLIKNPDSNVSFPLEIADVLNSCRDNKTIVIALHLHEIFNFETKFNYKDQIDVDKKLNELQDQFNVDELLVSSSVKDDDVNSTFEEFKNLKNETDTATVFPDDENFLKALNATENIFPELNDKCSQIKIEYDSLKNRFNATQSNMSSLDTIEVTINANLKVVNETLEKLRDPETINPILSEVTKDYTHRILKHVDDYVTFTKFSLNNTVGNCLPAWNVFVTIRGAICENVIDPINGYWFGFGWALFFFLPTLIVAVKLSRHLRNMERSDKVVYSNTPQHHY